MFRDFASIKLGGKTVELHYTGLNHTDDMAVVRFPESSAELVKIVRLEQYSHLMEYEMSRASNVAGAFEMLTARRGR